MVNSVNQGYYQITGRAQSHYEIVTILIKCQTRFEILRNSMNKFDGLKQLQTIPGVGKSIAQDLWDLDIRVVEDLKQKNPEQLYQQLCTLRGRHIDRCMLYVLRCAVYYAAHKKYNPELLKWWSWKDQSS